MAKILNEKNIYYLFGLFLIWSFIGLFTSWNRFETFYEILWWIFYGCLAFIPWKKIPKAYSYGLISISVILGCIGIFSIMLGNVSPDRIRLISLFGSHNAFAGFLFIPLLLSIYFALKECRLFGYFSSAFLLGCFILTFSRGAYLSLFLAVTIFTFQYRKQIKENIKGLVVISVFSLIIPALVIFSVQKQFQSKVEAFGGETISENAFTARLFYFKDAFNVFKEKPILGVGLGNYKLGLSVTKELPEFYSADPHNIYLKKLAEIGLGGIFFSLFMIYVGIYVFLKKKTPFEAILATGIVATIIHNAMDVDWRNKETPIIFFTALSFFLVKSYDWKKNTFLIVFLLALILMFPATNSNPEVLFRKGFIDKAIEKSPYDSRFYAIKADMVLNNVANKDEKAKWAEIVTIMEKSSNYNRSGSLDFQKKLMIAYINSGQKEKAKALAQDIANRYRNYLLSDWFMGNPQKDAIRENFNFIVTNLK